MKLIRLSILAALPACIPAPGTEPVPHRLRAVPLQQVTVEDEFWSPKRTVWQGVTIRDSFRKFEDDRGGALNNFDKVRDGKLGSHAGPPWYDGLIYEMIRGSSDFLAAHPSPELDRQLDGYIARIAAAAARDPDGYVNTYTQLEEPGHRWGLNGGLERWQHEVYNAGALVDAGIHHYRATGKTTLLNVAVKYANYMSSLMGPPPRKNIVPSHSLPEEALVELYLLFRNSPDLKRKVAHAVDENRYLQLAEFWIENRGNHVGKPDWIKDGNQKAEAFIRAQGYGDGRPSWGAYAQDHKPVLQQESIEGHAVRATLMCTGLAAAARVNQRQDYYAAAQRLWENMVFRKTHITGGTGAFANDEKFGPDYVLPNDAYLETCAAVGAGFFHRNMNLAFGDSRYIDELERVLYNGALSGVSLKGDTYFYENPLEAGKDRQRWVWHTCPCCPPMFLKLMGAMPGYIYAQDDTGVYVNLFAGSRATVSLGQTKIALRQTTRYPWDGDVKIAIDPAQPAEFDVSIRIPGWCRKATLKVDGKPVPSQTERGYARIHRAWRAGDTVELSMAMPVERVKAHPRVEADIGRVALMRGPVVYCLESADNGGQVRNLVLPAGAELSAEFRKDLLGGVVAVTGSALSVDNPSWEGKLYVPFAQLPQPKPVRLTAVPYYANANRGPVEMVVWIPESVRAQ